MCAHPLRVLRPPLRRPARANPAAARRHPPSPLQEVAKWLPTADARRARLACRAWRSALEALATTAATPTEACTVTRWRAQLDSIVASLPCLRELTVGSKLSDVGAQQLAVLRGASQLRCLRVPHGGALRDRSMQVRVCAGWRMLAHAGKCGRVQAHADACWLMRRRMHCVLPRILEHGRTHAF